MKRQIFINLFLLLTFTLNVKAQTTFEKIFRVNNHSTEVDAVFPVADGFILLSQHGQECKSDQTRFERRICGWKGHAFKVHSVTNNIEIDANR